MTIEQDRTRGHMCTYHCLDQGVLHLLIHVVVLVAEGRDERVFLLVCESIATRHQLGSS